MYPVDTAFLGVEVYMTADCFPSEYVPKMAALDCSPLQQTAFISTLPACLCDIRTKCVPGDTVAAATTELGHSILTD